MENALFMGQELQLGVIVGLEFCGVRIPPGILRQGGAFEILST